MVLEAEDTLTIQLVTASGETTVLKDGLKVQAGEVVDGTFMSAKALDSFLAGAVQEAKERGVLFSAHLKAP